MFQLATSSFSLNWSEMLRRFFFMMITTATLVFTGGFEDLEGIQGLEI